MPDDTRMEFWATIGSLLRRRRVIIPALVIAMALAVVAYLGTPTSYTSSTTMILTTTQYGGTESQDPTKPTELTNPMLNFNASLLTTTAILIQTMGTKSVADELGVGGPTTLIVNDGRTNPDLLGLNGPFMYVEVTSTSAATAQQVVKDAQALMRQKLKEWQSSLNAPEKTYVSLIDVVPPNAPAPDRGHGTKLGFLAFVFGFLLCLGIAYLSNQRRLRKRARAAAKRPAVAAAPPGGGSWDDHDPRPPVAPIAFPEGDEEEAEPAVVATYVTEPEPAGAVSPFMKPEPRFPSRLQRKNDAFLRPVPLKQKVRSRNR
jgi:hypothetical protein